MVGAKPEEILHTKVTRSSGFEGNHRLFAEEQCLERNVHDFTVENLWKEKESISRSVISDSL